MTYFINRNIKNNEFELAYKSDFFVDKTELIDKINKSVNVKERFLCITRPRRFGKTINAMMLEAYYSKNANYETATLKDIKLIPAVYIMEELRKDYKQMKNMIYGEVPSFDELLSSVRLLEAEINSLK